MTGPNRRSILAGLLGAPAAGKAAIGQVLQKTSTLPSPAVMEQEINLPDPGDPTNVFHDAPLERRYYKSLDKVRQLTYLARKASPEKPELFGIYTDPKRERMKSWSPAFIGHEADCVARQIKELQTLENRLVEEREKPTGKKIIEFLLGAEEEEAEE